MNDLYKNHILDAIDGTMSKLKLIELMLDGTKKPDVDEAKRYISEINHQLTKVTEMVEIS